MLCIYTREPATLAHLAAASIPYHRVDTHEDAWAHHREHPEALLAYGVDTIQKVASSCAAGDDSAIPDATLIVPGEPAKMDWKAAGATRLAYLISLPVGADGLRQLIDDAESAHRSLT